MMHCNFNELMIEPLAHIIEIRRFWPPLRSLETLHDNLSSRQLDSFLERLMNVRTPMPSPPKTPVNRDTDGLVISLWYINPSNCHSVTAESPDITLNDTIKRLALMRTV